jgi:hypothetical protein
MNAEQPSSQSDIAIAALARIAFLPCRYPNSPDQIARHAMARLAVLQDAIDRESPSKPDHMPTLLAIAEAAAAVVAIDADPNGSVDANGSAIDRLSSALSLLPNADFTGPTTGPVPETGVAGSGANPC